MYQTFHPVDQIRLNLVLTDTIVKSKDKTLLMMTFFSFVPYFSNTKPVFKL